MTCRLLEVTERRKAAFRTVKHGQVATCLGIRPGADERRHAWSPHWLNRLVIDAEAAQYEIPNDSVHVNPLSPILVSNPGQMVQQVTLGPALIQGSSPRPTRLSRPN